MELFLNLLWLVVALLASATWLRHRFARLDKAGRRREAIALICALFLLFPVISLTDDLHAEVVLVEDAAASKRQAAVSAHQLHSAHTAPVAAAHPAITVFGLSAPSSVFAGCFDSLAVAPIAAAFHRIPARSPPFSVL